MKTTSNTRKYLWVATLCAVLALAAVPAEAQREYEPLFDKFNLKVEGSWVNISTEIRLDSEILGEGTTLNFEDLGLATDKTIPTIAFEWQIAKRHRVGVRWQDINRSSTTHVEDEIHWGDEVIPVDATLNLDFGVTQTFVDYAFYPWVKERWAAGFGLGFRWMDFTTDLTWEGLNAADDGRSQASASGPLPYLYFEYRRLFSDRWRFMTGLGWLSGQGRGHRRDPVGRPRRPRVPGGQTVVVRRRVQSGDRRCRLGGHRNRPGQPGQRRPELGHRRHQRFRAGEVLRNPIRDATSATDHDLNQRSRARTNIVML